MKVNEDKNPLASLESSPRPAPESSLIARLISEQLTGTTEHADAVDKLIRENGDVTCIYCAELTLHGLTLNEQGFWESTAKQIMADHMMACPKRPEKKLLEKIEELENREHNAQAILDAIRTKLRDWAGDDNANSAEVLLVSIINLAAGKDENGNDIE